MYHCILVLFVFIKWESKYFQEEKNMLKTYWIQSKKDCCKEKKQLYYN